MFPDPSTAPGARRGWRRRRAAGIAIAVMALGLALVAGCGTLNFVKRRLPPPTKMPGGYLFRFEARSAKVVQLAGSWPANNWLSGQGQTQGYLIGEMSDPDGDGVWERVEQIPTGRWEYKFVVDRVTWKEDPNNPQRVDDPYGGKNSLIEVR